MSRAFSASLLVIAVATLQLACGSHRTDPEYAINDPPSGSTGKSDPDAGSKDGGNGGVDGGVDGGAQTCDPKAPPSSCPTSQYCACRSPGDGGVDCHCYLGTYGDPCPTGAAVCGMGLLCRATGGNFFGRCGNGTTQMDPCDANLVCAPPRTCTGTCADYPGSCCQ